MRHFPRGIFAQIYVNASLRCLVAVGLLTVCGLVSASEFTDRLDKLLKEYEETEQTIQKANDNIKTADEKLQKLYKDNPGLVPGLFSEGAKQRLAVQGALQAILALVVQAPSKVALGADFARTYLSGEAMETLKIRDEEAQAIGTQYKEVIKLKEDKEALENMIIEELAPRLDELDQCVVDTQTQVSGLTAQLLRDDELLNAKFAEAENDVVQLNQFCFDLALKNREISAMDQDLRGALGQQEVTNNLIYSSVGALNTNMDACNLADQHLPRLKQQFTTTQRLLTLAVNHFYQSVETSNLCANDKAPQKSDDLGGLALTASRKAAELFSNDYQPVLSQQEAYEKEIKSVLTNIDARQIDKLLDRAQISRKTLRNRLGILDSAGRAYEENRTACISRSSRLVAKIEQITDRSDFLAKKKSLIARAKRVTDNASPLNKGKFNKLKAEADQAIGMYEKLNVSYQKLRKRKGDCVKMESASKSYGLIYLVRYFDHLDRSRKMWDNAWQDSYNRCVAKLRRDDKAKPKPDNSSSSSGGSSGSSSGGTPGTTPPDPVTGGGDVEPEDKEPSVPSGCQRKSFGIHCPDKEEPDPEADKEQLTEAMSGFTTNTPGASAAATAATVERAPEINPDETRPDAVFTPDDPNRPLAPAQTVDSGSQPFDQGMGEFASPRPMIPRAGEGSSHDEDSDYETPKPGDTDRKPPKPQGTGSTPKPAPRPQLAGGATDSGPSCERSAGKSAAGLTKSYVDCSASDTTGGGATPTASNPPIPSKVCVKARKSLVKHLKLIWSLQGRIDKGNQKTCQALPKYGKRLDKLKDAFAKQCTTNDLKKRVARAENQLGLYRTSCGAAPEPPATSSTPSTPSGNRCALGLDPGPLRNQGGGGCSLCAEAFVHNCRLLNNDNFAYCNNLASGCGKCPTPLPTKQSDRDSVVRKGCMASQMYNLCVRRPDYTRKQLVAKVSQSCPHR